MDAVVIFVCGAVLGSFLNVCIRRWPRDHSVLAPASHCYRCHRPIRPVHNIPILSYLFLRGRCAYCGYKFSSQYVVVEVLTPLALLGLFFHYGTGMEYLVYAVLTCWLIVAAFIDINHYMIYDRLSYSLALLGLAVAACRGWQDAHDGGDWRAALLYPLGLLLGGGLLLILHLIWPTGMGQGDVKLAAAIGAWLGPRLTGEALFLAMLLGAAWGLLLVLTGRKKLKDRLPFGAFIALAVYFRLLAGGDFPCL